MYSYEEMVSLKWKLMVLKMPFPSTCCCWPLRLWHHEVSDTTDATHPLKDKFFVGKALYLYPLSIVCCPLSVTCLFKSFLLTTFRWIVTHPAVSCSSRETVHLESMSHESVNLPCTSSLIVSLIKTYYQGRKSRLFDMWDEITILTSKYLEEEGRGGNNTFVINFSFWLFFWQELLGFKCLTWFFYNKHNSWEGN